MSKTTLTEVKKNEDERVFFKSPQNLQAKSEGDNTRAVYCVGVATNFFAALVRCLCSAINRKFICIAYYELDKQFGGKSR